MRPDGLTVYYFSALLSGADGVRASEGFPCTAAATEPTGCALPEGPGRARWQARERSERVRRGRQRGSGGDALPALCRSQRGRDDDTECAVGDVMLCLDHLFWV